MDFVVVCVSRLSLTVMSATFDLDICQRPTQQNARALSDAS